MQRKRLSIKGKLVLSLLVIMLSTLLLFKYYNDKIRPIIKIMAVSKIEDVATGVINESVLGELEKEDVAYDDLVTLEKDANGYVSAIKTNSVLVNKLKANVALKVMDDVTVMEGEQIEIPVGSLTRIEIFSGCGPSIPIKIVPVGSVFVEIHQEFLPAGINQTLHRIMIDVTVEADIVLPTELTTAHYTSEFIVAETVIVGSVPGAYADISAFSEK